MISGYGTRQLDGATTPTAVRVLEFLVRRDTADEAAIIEALELQVPDVRAALATLERDRLVVRTEPPSGRRDRTTGGAGARWAAQPPRAVLTAYLAQRRLELAEWEHYVDGLDAAYRAAQGRQDDLLPIEVVAGADQVGMVYQELLETATSEILHVARPPYLPAARHLLGGRGRQVVGAEVTMRSVYESSTFMDPVSLETALQARVSGAQLRLAAHVPLKLVIVDRKTAMLPADGDDPAAASLVVRSPTLVVALAELFEQLWDSAVPQALWGSGHDAFARLDAVRSADGAPSAAPSPAVQLDERTRGILDLMAGGLTDEAIAKALGVSRRTVQAAVSGLADALGARTRFQIALRAVELGLVTAR